jgi:Sulfotransferase domain
MPLGRTGTGYADLTGGFPDRADYGRQIFQQYRLMPVLLDPEAVNAAFAQPNSDGSFPTEFEDYLNELGRRRPSVVLAFAPKAAGTYLRTAAIAAVGGKLVRTVHAQGGRDATFYLPVFLMYYVSNFPGQTMVTHVHMQALLANRHFIEALDLKPVIMMRAIPDMLASYADMLESDSLSPVYWNNICLPENYARMDDEAKGDFLVDMMGPWYASYFATWLDYTARAPERVLILEYDEFRADPVATLEKLLAHSGLPRSPEQCRTALDAVWQDRGSFRYNKGVSGRGRTRFTPAQIVRLKRQVDFYPELAPLRGALIPPP